MPTPPTPPRPLAELRARGELALRALDDAREILADLDPGVVPDDLDERERKIAAICDEVEALFPMGPRLSAEEEEALARDAEPLPGPDELRAFFLEIERALDDPARAGEVAPEVSREKLDEALRALDEMVLLKSIADKARAIVEELDQRTRGAAKRHGLEREAKRRAPKLRS